MLLEYFRSNTFEIIIKDAANASLGICEGLKTLEENPDAESSDFLKVKDDTWFKQWLQIEPAFFATDLRPYIFIAKDNNKDLFIKTANENVEKAYNILLDSRLVINAHINLIRDLTETEVSEVFDLLKKHILSQKKSGSIPSGYEGLKLLVGCHSQKQADFVALIEHFEKSKIGVWILDYSEANLNPENSQKLTLILSGFAKTNKTLKSALDIANTG
jgi:hypothetical protein